MEPVAPALSYCATAGQPAQAGRPCLGSRLLLYILS